MSPRRLRAVAFTAVAALAGVACAPSNDSAVDTPGVAPTETVATATDAPADAETNASAPEIMRFTSTLVGGGELSGAALADKPTAFWFWSPT